MAIGEPMVDVRSPGEFSGELPHMPDYLQEGAMRGGHIPGACPVGRRTRRRLRVLTEPEHSGYLTVRRGK
jgi:3-mercaptopyruvate sulfurtransferase SseA